MRSAHVLSLPALLLVHCHMNLGLPWHVVHCIHDFHVLVENNQIEIEKQQEEVAVEGEGR